ncbi:tyrosine--tRNA ligase [Candidatus Peregrinibacteria bacterium]|nr:tyrosine--tRNA ligase [Candidatus Peregrinibacteria bacterium]
MPKTDVISELLDRGVKEVIVRKELYEKLRKGEKISLYLGIDPTGSRLHLGHAIALRKLRDFQRLGHRVIFLIGDFTALIGDTSDKDSPRPPLSPEQISENFRTYKAQASKILDFSKIELKQNSEWLSKMDLKKLIHLASQFTVQQMIKREMYQKRIAQDRPIALHEFLYPLMQGYDSVAMDVDLEIGGNDQLFNMLAGRVLQKVLKNRDKHVMTLKLLEGTDGRKMAKTYNNVINITDSPDEQYGKIMSMKDELILPYFELCTDVPVHEIKESAQAMKAGENPKDYKMRLAREIITLYHGSQAASQAEKEFVKIFQQRGKPSDIPEKTLSKKSYDICELLFEAGLAKSKSEARRLVEGGGVKVNDEKITDPKIIFDLGKKPLVIQVGKRHFIQIIG